MRRKGERFHGLKVYIGLEPASQLLAVRVKMTQKVSRISGHDTRLISAGGFIAEIKPCFTKRSKMLCFWACACGCEGQNSKQSRTSQR